MTDQTDSTRVRDTKHVTGAWFEHGISRIYYEDIGTGDPLLLLPGFAGSIEEFSVLRQALLTAGYRVIAADLPGSGRSQPQPRSYSVSYFEEDAHAFAALLDHLGTAPAHLLGFSDGGEVALLIAVLFPARVRSLLTWGAAGLLSDPTGQLREVMVNIVDHPIPPLQGFRDYLVAYYGESNARAMTQSLSGAIGAIIEARGGDLSLSKADRITCPALLITGEHDPFAPPAILAQLAARIPAAEKREVENTGHDIHNARPEWFVQTVLDWLKSHEGL